MIYATVRPSTAAVRMGGPGKRVAPGPRLRHPWAVDVRFSRSPHGGSVALIERSDGLTLRMRSYDRKHSVPHDLAHFVAERAFVLPQGVWGSIAAGALFRSMEVVSGRCRHDSRARSAAIIAENACHIGLAEIVAGVVHRGLDLNPAGVERELRWGWAAVREGPCPLPIPVLHDAVAELRQLAQRWQLLPDDEQLRMQWAIKVTPTRRRRKR